MIGFAGLSHLGVNYSLATAAKGFDVRAYDPSPELVADLERGKLSVEAPGFTRRLRGELLTSGAAAEIYYQVETLIFGRAVERALHPERHMVGAADPAKPLPEAFRRWHETFHCPVLVMRYESAELAKIAINLFLVSSVSTTNMLAEVCEQIGADWSE